MPDSYSQHGEDLWILGNLRPPEKGVFVEVGAYDGMLSSNTLLYEQLGWRGICIEADPLNASYCANNRKASTVCAAIGSNVGIHRFFINKQDRGLSGLCREPGDQMLEIGVAVVRLEHVIETHGFKSVDLLSIDTEGTEIDAWRSIGGLRPPIVILEHFTLGQPPNGEAIKAEMAAEGYTMVHVTPCNMIFHRK